MTLSYRAAPVQAYNGRDQVYQFTFPWPAPAGDGGLGGGGADSITVRMGPDDYRLAWNSSVGSYPPAGYGYPAQPTLTGSEDWWIHGVHGYGRVTWSPNYGVVVSGVVGLRPNGTVGHVNASFLPDVTANYGNGEKRWRYMAPYYGTGGEGGSNSWNYHLGYDLGLRSDLVVVREERRVYRLSGSWGSTATRGAALWSMTAAHVAAGYTLDCDLPASGFDRVHLPWRNEWWIVKIFDDGGQVANSLIWGFNHTQSGDGSAFNVGIPAAAMSRLTATYPDNLCLSVDQLGQRVFAAQADILATPTTDNGCTKYPLLLWEINPATHVWTAVTLASTMYVFPPGKSRGHNPLCWHGGFRWIYWDRYGGDSGATVYYENPSSGYSVGSFKPRLIFIPKNAAPRNITFTSNACGSIVSPVLDKWTNNKHNEIAYRPANDRVYFHGGDMQDAGSGQQSIFSFDPENAPATLTMEQAFNFSSHEFRPMNVDEHGWALRTATDDFWMMYGYPFPTSCDNTRHPGWGAPYSIDAIANPTGQWQVETGGTEVLWKWNPTTRIWTTHALTAATGETGPFGLESVGSSKFTSAHQKRWYYDSSADRMVIAAYGGNILYQTPCVKFITFNEGTPKYRVFIANRLTSGSTTLPDGRSVPNPLGFEDAAAFDSTTGYLYVFNNLTGDVFRIQTWAGVGNYAYPSYSGPSGPTLPVEWCCKIHPTTDTGNVTKLVFMHGAVWIVNTYAANRARVFSWAPGDAHAWEHDTPFGMCCAEICVYKHAGVDKMVAIGGAAVPTQRNGPEYKRIWTGAVT